MTSWRSSGRTTGWRIWRSYWQDSALATVGIDGVEPPKIVEHCWSKYRLIVVPIDYGTNATGVRVTPNVYTTLDEVDLFGDIMERIATKGL